MSRTPEPRPALRKAPDGGLHPAAPRPMPTDPAAEASEGSSPFRPGDLRARKTGAAKGSSKAASSDQSKSKGKGKAAKEPTAELTVTVPKHLRKQAKARAKADRLKLDDVVATLLRGWVDN
jgi:hypothetical protein